MILVDPSIIKYYCTDKIYLLFFLFYSYSGMQPTSKDYVLEFKEGFNYKYLDEDSKSIFWAFNIPSWMHPSYKVRILSRLD